ncbi:MAG: RluA family pseudouridine synthase [Clostridia bacterium]
MNNILQREFPALSLNTIYKALRKKDIRVNDVRINENITLHTGDVVKVFIADEFLFANKSNITTFANFSYSSVNIPVIYEDGNILIVDKPAEIEVTGDNSLTTILSAKYGFAVYPCHRLDRNTTGLTLFAKNKQSEQILFDKFKNHEIEKHYFCRVYGIPTKKHAILNDYLFKDTKKSMVYICSSYKKGYQNISTEYFVLSSNKSENTSILEVILHTGRTHQIRAHLAYIGYPIIGDGKYGHNDINKKFKCKTQNLCSYKMKFKFIHPSQHLEYLNGKEFEKTNVQF